MPLTRQSPTGLGRHCRSAHRDLDTRAWAAYFHQHSAGLESRDAAAAAGCGRARDGVGCRCSQLLSRCPRTRSPLQNAVPPHGAVGRAGSVPPYTDLAAATSSASLIRVTFRERTRMTRRLATVAVVTVAALMAFAACGKSTSGGGTTDNSGKTLIIGIDLPLQGASADTSNSTNNAMQLYLDSVSSKAGNYTVKLKKYDDSTAATGTWDDGDLRGQRDRRTWPTRTRSRSWAPTTPAAPRSRSPMLNQDPNGPMLMVSHANTNPGLTKTWDPGEPRQVLPDRHAQLRPRHHHRRLPGLGGRAVRGAGPEASRSATSSTTTRSTARASRRRSQTRRRSRASPSSATTRGTPSSRTTPRCSRASRRTNPDCVYLGGIYDNNGGQLIKDKVAVLGDNTKVKLIGAGRLHRLPGPGQAGRRPRACT